jgi:hypothetical protein
MAMNMLDAPQLDWRVLNDETQVASKDGQIVVIVFTVQAGSVDGRKWLEFCWIPIDQPDLVEVHFGVGPDAGSTWDTRWERARAATEWEYARRRSAPS